MMPSERHSIIAKARRYRDEPERMVLVASDPLTVVIDGFHGHHTVVSTGSGLMCSCGRFKRGGGLCAHTLAVEQRYFTADTSVRDDQIADFMRFASEQADGGAASTEGLLDHVVSVIWDVGANAPALMLARGLVRAASGQLTILSARAGAEQAEPLVDTHQTLERLVTSSAWDDVSVRISAHPDNLAPHRSTGRPATLFAIPIDAAAEARQPSADELVAKLNNATQVPLLVVPDQARVIDRVRRVLAVVNSSPASLAVLAAAAALAQPIGAHVTVLHTGPRAPERSRPTAPASARHWADITAEQLRAMGIAASGRAVLGSATDAIESIAETERADVIVLATPVRGELRGMPAKLLAATNLPLLLVRRDARLPRMHALGTS